MIISVLASGSKGNCTFLSVENKVILIDAGMTCAYVEEQMKEPFDLEPKNTVIDNHFI